VDDTRVAAFPDFGEIIKANNQRAFLPRTLVCNELANAVHRSMQNIFRRFINVFARPEHPLAVSLDDLQRLDAATVDKAVEMKVNFYAAHLKGWA